MVSSTYQTRSQEKGLSQQTNVKENTAGLVQDISTPDLELTPDRMIC